MKHCVIVMKSGHINVQWIHDERFMRGDFEIIDGEYWMRDLVL